MDQAGWLTTARLDVPDTIGIVALPAKCPELSPVENIWLFMRDNWLSKRVFTSCDNIVHQPWRIISIGRRKWARGS